jgi:formylglycine-generating enzyme required for sulfatase activity
VSWYEAVAFCNWRSVKESLTPAYDSAGHATLSASGYRLPTEVEWEYAAAKGASGQPERIYAWGDTWDSNKAVCSVAPATATKTADVGSKSTAGDTPQSLADMSGNVWEWCSDNCQSDASVASVPNRYYFLDDSTSQYLMVRGGAWYNSDEVIFRCAFRGSFGNPDYHYSNDGFGFRVVRPGAVLEAPTGLSASPLSSSSIRLTWTDNSSNETGFKVERSPDGTSGWVQVQLAATNATSWDDSGLSLGTTYYYRVRATNSAGDSAYSNMTSASTLLIIAMVTIDAAGDSFGMGDGIYGPNPPVQQTISYNFTMSRYEITNTQFAQFIADYGYSTQTYWTTNGWGYKQGQGWTQPAYWIDSSFNGTNQPVVGVSWYEAVAYCNWRSAREGLTPAYDSAGQATLSASGYRLPTEVEWEYSAAKGASGQPERVYPWGATWNSDNAVCSVLPASATKTADVGSKSTAGDTPQSLADMSGNVWEWCSDNVQDDASVSATTDRYYFVDDSTSQYSALRGGAWYDISGGLFRCACRYDGGLGGRVNRVGFRVVRP